MSGVLDTGSTWVSQTFVSGRQNCSGFKNVMKTTGAENENDTFLMSGSGY